MIQIGKLIPDSFYHSIMDLTDIATSIHIMKHLKEDRPQYLSGSDLSWSKGMGIPP